VYTNWDDFHPNINGKKRYYTSCGREIRLQSSLGLRVIKNECGIPFLLHKNGNLLL